MDNRENDIIIKKMFEFLKDKHSLTDEEHQRAMSNEFSYLDDEDNK